MTVRHGRRLGLGLVGLLLAGCGYSFDQGLAPRGIRTVTLAVVGNETWRQRLEVDLAAALARELPVSTNLVLAAPDRADATLRVTFQSADERTLVPGDLQDPVREGALVAAVRLTVVARTGAVVLERTLLDRTEFRDPIGEDLTSARGELANDLARKIALALDAGF